MLNKNMTFSYNINTRSVMMLNIHFRQNIVEKKLAKEAFWHNKFKFKRMLDFWLSFTFKLSE